MVSKIIVGRLFFLTKIHLLKIKKHLREEGFTVKYIRDDFDFIEIIHNKVKYIVTQDGLVYGIRNLTKIVDNVAELNHFIIEVIYKDILQMHVLDTLLIRKLVKKVPEVLIFDSSMNDQKADGLFKSLGRNHDYTISITKPFRIKKYYGNGLAVFKYVFKSLQRNRKLKTLLESQIVLSDYQNIIPYLVSEYHDIWRQVTDVRNKSQLRMKELPQLIDQLLEAERQIKHTMSQLQQFDNFIAERQRIVIQNKDETILKNLKLFDFDEMINLNDYVNEQWIMARDYVHSTLTLIDTIYKENSQKEMTLLQVIFAVGTIATIVSLGAMPGARFFFTDPLTNKAVAGQLIAFSLPDLARWSMISIAIGIASFYIVNKFYMNSKKLKIVNLIRSKTSKKFNSTE
ncbi:hypothetical protein K9M79_02095 [Candidatus Woesearchaeota archaeon]|nr:hypothetical protein [Candidatus Woesearchaeota archaeon]